MAKVIAKYLLDDSTIVPLGTILRVGVDATPAAAMWVEHTSPIDESMQMSVFVVATDVEFTGVGTYVGSVITTGIEHHVYAI